MSTNHILAGCDVDLKVGLWLSVDGKEIRLTNENWPSITAQFGYRVGDMVSVTINRAIVKYEESK